jgi:FkbM family methyltransferase
MSSDILKRRVELAVSLLKHNPALLMEVLWKKCRLLLPLPKHIVQRRINGIMFEFDFDYAPLQMKMVYVGTYGIDTVQLLKRYLKRGDTFIDVGANIGYISAVAVSLVGKQGQVHSFEPVSSHFHRLQRLSDLNPEYTLKVNHCALGEESGRATLAISLEDMAWNSLVPGYTGSSPIRTEEVQVMRLDTYLESQNIEEVALIKLDTEGFELPILRGLQNFLDRTERLPKIICEIQPRALSLLGFSLEHLDDLMKHYNYRAFSLVNTRDEVDITEMKDFGEVLFLPARS